MLVNPPQASSIVRLHWLHGSLLLGLGLVAYHNSFGGPFIFDDLTWIVDNKNIRQLWPLGPVLTSTRPVVNFTFAVNYALGGTDVFGYHLVNFAIHLASALTLYGVVRRTLLHSSTADAEPSRAAWFAATTAGLWLVHPLQTQSVTYVVQRCESLAGLLYLSCLYCVIRGTHSQRRTLWYLGAIACVWIGTGTKEVIATAPVVILLYDRAFLSSSWTNALRARWSLYVALTSSWCWLLGTVGTTLTAETGSAGFNAPVISPMEHLLTQSGVILHYLKLVVWPHPLCLDYYWPIARSTPAIVLSGLLVISLLLTCLWAMARRPALGFLGLSAFLILAPTSSIVPIADLAVEHRMYLPLATLIVLVLLAGRVLLSRAAERFHRLSGARVGVAALVLVLSSFTLLTVLRNNDYQSVESIWGSVLAVRPSNPRAFNEIGRVLYEQGRKPDAYRCYRQAVALSDQSDMKPLAPYYYNLASSLHDQRLHAEAIHHYRRALHLQPRSTRVLINLGAALSETGNLDAAIECYEETLKLRPRDAVAHNNLALALEKKGQDEEALRNFEQALEGEPRIAEIRLNMARTLSRLGRSRPAITQYLAFVEDCEASGRLAKVASAIESALSLAADLGDQQLTKRLKALHRKYARK